ncbi:MAG: cation:dicarboxylase symporter family transporter [Simkaniaceae bacterium]
MLRISLPKQVLIACVVGIFLGIFLGEDASLLQPIGATFIMFIKMVILPYIPSSIIHGIGSTSPKMTKRILKEGWIFLFFLWGITFTALYILAELFPTTPTAIIVSTVGKENPITQNFLKYLIPENPIYDLANNIVPAVAIFGIIIGIAVMHLKYKEPLISFLERVNNTIELILKWLTYVAPIGIMALFANTFGNVYPEDLLTLASYLLPFVFIVLLLTFWVLPAVLVSFTPLTYDNILVEFRRVCFLAFILGAPSIAFPFLNSSVQRYAEKFNVKDPDFHNLSQSVVPLSYSFAQIGNLLIVFFVLFLAYYFRQPISFMEKFFVSLFSIPMSFGGPELSVNAVSFLLPKLGFPKQSLEIYDQTSVITANFSTLLSVASMFAFTILLLEAYYHKLHIRIFKLSKHFILFFLILSAIVFFIKPYIKQKHDYLTLYETMDIQTVIEDPLPPVKVITPENSHKYDWKSNGSGRVLADILKEGILRVGYYPYVPPFNYFNWYGKLVGYDIAFAYSLAKFLKCELIFLPFTWENLEEDLTKGYFDIAMAPVLVSPDNIRGFPTTQSYFDSPNVLVVRAKDKENFSSYSKIQGKSFTLGLFYGFEMYASQYLPKAKVKNIESINAIQHDHNIKAIMIPKIEALIFCRKYPEFIIMDYGQQLGKPFFSYAVRMRSGGQAPMNFLGLFEKWYEFIEQEGFVQEQKDYWINGKIPLKQKPRWSIMSNVLHWK